MDAETFLLAQTLDAVFKVLEGKRMKVDNQTYYHMNKTDRLLVTDHGDIDGTISLQNGGCAEANFALVLEPCTQHMDALRHAADILETNMRSVKHDRSH